MTTKKPAAGKTRAKKLKVNKQTLKDLDPKGKKKVVGGFVRYTKTNCNYCPESTKLCGMTTLCDPGTAMTQCRQITCA